MTKQELDQQMYDFICRHLSEQGRPPTRREIVAGEVQRQNGVLSLIAEEVVPLAV